MSINWLLDVEPRPAILVLPPDAASLDEADAAIELWEHYSRKRLDPSQRLAVQVMMAEDAVGKWAASTTGREMPRQNGKGDEVEVVELWGLVQRSEAILHTVHDAVLLASQTQQRMLGVLEGHADLRRKVKRRWLGTGQQMIELRNGGIIWYRTRTNGGGRGVDDVTRLVIDEAQHATEEHLSAVSPTLLANSNPQMNVLGTAGLAGKSDWWWQNRVRALSPDPGRFGYVGHTAERVRVDGDRVIQEPVNVQDRAGWRASNPSLAAGRGQGMPFFEEQLKRLGPASFAREHLCVWDPMPGAGDAGTIANWASLVDAESVAVSHHAWALAVSPLEDGPQWSSIGIAGRREDGLLHVAWVKHAPGSGWVVEAAKEMYAKRPLPLRVHKSGPEGMLIKQLVEAGVEVEPVSSMDVAQSCGAFIAAAVGTPASDGQEAVPPSLRHLGQPSLTLAVRSAVLRSGVDGAVVWSARKSSVEITPLRAVTVALGGVPAAAEFFMY